MNNVVNAVDEVQEFLMKHNVEMSLDLAKGLKPIYLKTYGDFQGMFYWKIDGESALGVYVHDAIVVRELGKEEDLNESEIMQMYNEIAEDLGLEEPLLIVHTKYQNVCVCMPEDAGLVVTKHDKLLVEKAEGLLDIFN